MNEQTTIAQTIFDRPNPLWKTVLRSKLTKNTAGPAFCIQGGGARGAWEAGVLAGLLTAGPNTTPSSIWGTSAGALNALWTRDPAIQAEPSKLLGYWTTLGRRLTTAAIAALLCFVFYAWVFWRWPKLIGSGTALAACALVLLGMLAKCRVLTRLPGLIPPFIARLIIPRPKDVSTGWYVYTCVSDVGSEAPPTLWNSSKRGWFCLDGTSSHRLAEDMSDGQMVDAFHVAVASASVPIAVHPTHLAGMTLLDGGLVANLPAGFILTNGSLGGAYVLCIVPRDVSELLSSNPIDYRTLRFLCELRDEQTKHRSDAAIASSWSGPAHTHIPIFVLSPKQRLKSGLIRFWPPLLRQEFWQGFNEATAFSTVLEEFRQEKVDLSREYLLEHVLEKSSVPTEEPPRGVWSMWANTGW